MVGVNFCGPYHTKCDKLMNPKLLKATFVCLSVSTTSPQGVIKCIIKAIRLEKVLYTKLKYLLLLSSDSFLDEVYIVEFSPKKHKFCRIGLRAELHHFFSRQFDSIPANYLIKKSHTISFALPHFTLVVYESGSK